MIYTYKNYFYGVLSYLLLLYLLTNFVSFTIFCKNYFYGGKTYPYLKTLNL